MILAHHVILTGYGHWAPNDPRGSLSGAFRSPELRALGAIHFGRKQTQPSLEELKAFYRAVEKYLKHSVLWLDHAITHAVGDAFGGVVFAERLTCYACAIMRNHAHLLVRRHRLRGHEIANLLTVASRKAVLEHALAPPGHPVWSEDAFVAFKDTPEAIRAAIQYIEGNFAKHRLPGQAWGFVTPYDGRPHR